MPKSSSYLWIGLWLCTAFGAMKKVAMGGMKGKGTKKAKAMKAVKKVAMKGMKGKVMKAMKKVSKKATKVLQPWQPISRGKPAQQIRAFSNGETIVCDLCGKADFERPNHLAQHRGGRTCRQAQRLSAGATRRLDNVTRRMRAKLPPLVLLLIICCMRQLAGASKEIPPSVMPPGMQVCQNILSPTHKIHSLIGKFQLPDAGQKRRRKQEAN